MEFKILQPEMFMIGKDDFDYVNFKGISDEKAVVRRKLVQGEY